MVVNGVNIAGLFTSDTATFVITGVSENLTLRFSLSNAAGVLTTFTELYSPDEHNTVTLYGLHELARTYMTMPGLLPAAALEGVSVDIAVQYLKDGEWVSLFSQKFYYCRQRIIRLDGSYSGFLSRYKNRKIRDIQPVHCAFLDHGQTLQLAVAYRAAGKAKYAVVDIATLASTGDMAIYDVSPAMAVVYLASMAEIHVDEQDVIYVDAILRNADGAMIDRIRHEVDRRYFPQQTVMSFYNLFGAPDSLVLTGKFEQESEMTATYGTINGQYLKLDTRLADKYTANTGYLEPAAQGAVKDLVSSSEVRLVRDGELQEVVTVTEITAVTVRPSTEPTNFKITYKLADGGEDAFCRDTDIRIFDKTFDYTFD